MEKALQVLDGIVSNAHILKQQLEKLRHNTCSAKFMRPCIGIRSYDEVLVSYHLTLRKLIEFGDYPLKTGNRLISESFAHVRGNKLKAKEMKMFTLHFGRDVPMAEVLEECHRRALAPACAHEILSFALQYPELQLQFPIVALGSLRRCVKGVYKCIVLGRVARMRDVDLCSDALIYNFMVGTAFLVVPIAWLHPEDPRRVQIGSARILAGSITTR